MVGCWSTLAYQIPSQDSIACATSSRAALVDLGVFISNLEYFVVLVVEKEVIDGKANLSREEYEWRMCFCHSEVCGVEVFSSEEDSSRKDLDNGGY